MSHGLLEPLLAHLLRGTHEPGLFRASRPIEEVRTLWKELTDEVGAGDDQVTAHERVAQRLAEDSDIHRVAAVLIHHLRNIDPLIPVQLYDKLLDIGM